MVSIKLLKEFLNSSSDIVHFYVYPNDFHIALKLINKGVVPFLKTNGKFLSVYGLFQGCCILLL